jgi:hypothetical protein
MTCSRYSLIGLAARLREPARTRRLTGDGRQVRTGSWCSAVRCIARIGCRERGVRIQVEQPESRRVAWSCTACGEAGVITGFAETELDMSAFMERLGSDRATLWVEMLIAYLFRPGVPLVARRRVPGWHTRGILDAPQVDLVASCLENSLAVLVPGP